MREDASSFLLRGEEMPSVRHRCCRGVYYYCTSMRAYPPRRLSAHSQNTATNAAWLFAAVLRIWASTAIHFMSYTVDALYSNRRYNSAFLADLTLSTTAATRLPPGQSRPPGQVFLRMLVACLSYYCKQLVTVSNSVVVQHLLVPQIPVTGLTAYNTRGCTRVDPTDHKNR